MLSRLRARLLVWTFVLAQTFDPRSRRGRLGTAGVIVAVTAVVVAVVLTSGSAPQPVAAPAPAPTEAASPAATTSGPGTSTPTASAPATPFRCSRAASADGSDAPTRICVPGIRVDASVMKLGLNRDQTVQVPPLSRVGDAGWYKYSAAPGEVGPTVVLGHVDSAQYGEGVFFKLSRLHKSDQVVVSRGDGRVATYVVDRVEQVSKSKFPSQEVYGTTSGPALRLVTCGGRYDPSAGRYLDNVIVYGTLQSLSRV